MEKGSTACHVYIAILQAIKNPPIQAGCKISIKKPNCIATIRLLLEIVMQI
nr:MAG TPA: hypothetical protein [Bacteriophage sp.]